MHGKTAVIRSDACGPGERREWFTALTSASLLKTDTTAAGTTLRLEVERTKKLGKKI